MLASVAPVDQLDYVSRFPHATIFHHPLWMDLLADCYGYRPDFLALQDGNGSVSVGLPVMRVSDPFGGRRAIALPFSDFCAPLGAANESTLSAFVRALEQWRIQNHLAQVQVRWPLPPQNGVFAHGAFLQHLTPLTGNPSEVFRTFRKTQVQRHIRQAERLGVTTHWGVSRDDLSSFYGLHIRTRRRLGVPVQPKRFFQLLWERLIQRGMGFILLAYQKEQLLAGALFLHLNKTLSYKFGASVPEHWKLRPNDLIFWHAIQWGCRNGYQILDWGRTDLDNDGLRDFKRGWGSKEETLHYSVLADEPPRPEASARGRDALRFFIQHSPPWVCREMGELFYRYAA